MTETLFQDRFRAVCEEHDRLLVRKNTSLLPGNGIYERYEYPVLTRLHTPVEWRYDLSPERNPYFMERFGINGTFNAGAIRHDGKYLLVVRVEGNDRKSFFAVAESSSGVDRFRFRDYPVRMPETEEPDTNVYDMRLTAHEDGWIYGIFCTERKDLSAPRDLSAAVAAAGIASTREFETWERLPDLKF